MSFIQRACSEHITHMLSYKKHLRVDAMCTLVNVVAYGACVVYHTARLCVVDSPGLAYDSPKPTSLRKIHVKGSITISKICRWI